MPYTMPLPGTRGGWGAVLNGIITDIDSRLTDVEGTEEHVHTGYAAASHTHTDKADTSHTHDFAATGHNHDSAYAPVHAHPYASTGHDHDASYAPVHSHPYAATGHTHAFGDVAGVASVSHSHLLGDLPVGTGSTQVARGDHTHAGGGVTYGSVVAETGFGQASASGASTDVSRADHTHGTPANPTARQRCTTNTAQSSSTTYSVPTGFAGFPVVAGRTYRYQAVLVYTTAAVTTGIRPSLTGPAMTDFLLLGQNQTAATATEMADVTATATDLPFTAGIVARTRCVIDGTFTPSANGTVNLQFRSEVNASAVTVLAGSYQIVEATA